MLTQRLQEALVEQETLRRYGLDEDALVRGRVDWPELRAIHADYRLRRERLAQNAEAAAAALRRLEAVHAVRTRIKDPQHLLAKIIRKQLQDPELRITVRDYTRTITDLAGVRALHRLPADWRPIDEFVRAHWRLVEPAVAYVAAAGDGEPYAARGCQVRVHPRGYRAVHYLLRGGNEDGAPGIELQVNTLFEEAWSEVDHAAAYPCGAADPACARLLEVLHRLARAGDDLAARVTGRDEQPAADGEEAERITAALALLRQPASE